MPRAPTFVTRYMYKDEIDGRPCVESLRGYYEGPGKDDRFVWSSGFDDTQRLRRSHVHRTPKAALLAERRRVLAALDASLRRAQAICADPGQSGLRAELNEAQRLADKRIVLLAYNEPTVVSGD